MRGLDASIGRPLCQADCNIDDDEHAFFPGHHLHFAHLPRVCASFTPCHGFLLLGVLGGHQRFGGEPERGHMAEQDEGIFFGTFGPRENDAKLGRLRWATGADTVSPRGLRTSRKLWTIVQPNARRKEEDQEHDEFAEKAKTTINNIVVHYHDDVTHFDEVHEDYFIGKNRSEMKHIQKDYEVKTYIHWEFSANQNFATAGEKTMKTTKSH